MFGADPKILTRRFKEERDNRDDKIHEASLLRLPVAETEDYGKRYP